MVAQVGDTQLFAVGLRHCRCASRREKQNVPFSVAGVSIRDLCARYGIETLRAYRTRSRQTIHKARKAKKEI